MKCTETDYISVSVPQTVTTAKVEVASAKCRSVLSKMHDKVDPDLLTYGQ